MLRRCTGDWRIDAVSLIIVHLNDLVLVVWSLIAGANLAGLLLAVEAEQQAVQQEPGAQNSASADAPPSPLFLRLFTLQLFLVWAILAAQKWSWIHFYWWPVITTALPAAVATYGGGRVWLRLARRRRRPVVPAPDASSNEAPIPDTEVPTAIASLERDVPEELAGRRADVDIALRSGEAAWSAYSASVDKVFWSLSSMSAYLFGISAVGMFVISFSWGPVPLTDAASAVACVLWPMCALTIAANLHLAATSLISLGHVRRYLPQVSTQVTGLAVFVGVLVLLVDDFLEVLFAILITSLSISLLATIAAQLPRLGLWYRRLLPPENAEFTLIGAWMLAYLSCCRSDLAVSVASRAAAWQEIEALASRTVYFLPHATRSIEGESARRYRKAVELDARKIAYAIRAHQRLLVLADANALADLRCSLAYGLLNACAGEWAKLRTSDDLLPRRRWRGKPLAAIVTAAVAIGLAATVRLVDGLVPAGEQIKVIATLLLVGALSASSAFGGSTEKMQDLTMRVTGMKQ